MHNLRAAPRGNNGDGFAHQSANPHPRAARPLAAIDTSTEPTFTRSPHAGVVGTRSMAAGGKVVPGTVRGCHGSGTTRFPAQGGHNGGCGTPTSATTVTAAIQLISAKRRRRPALWRHGSSEPRKIFFN